MEAEWTLVVIERLPLGSPRTDRASYSHSSPQWQDGSSKWRGDESLATTELDLSLLSQATLCDLCDAWFEKYHPWFPVLYKLSILAVIQNSTHLVDSSLSIVLKAVVAVTLPHWSLSNPSSAVQREQLSTHFRSQVIMEAIGNLSLQSLQAVLITTILDYGAGKLSEFWNLVALCKK